MKPPLQSREHDMRLDDHFGSGSTLQRNERVKVGGDVLE